MRYRGFWNVYSRKISFGSMRMIYFFLFFLVMFRVRVFGVRVGVVRWIEIMLLSKV